jgi:hypothetical protein
VEKIFSRKILKYLPGGNTKLATEQCTSRVAEVSEVRQQASPVTGEGWDVSVSNIQASLE